MKQIAILFVSLFLSLSASAIELNAFDGDSSGRRPDQYYSYYFGRILEGQVRYADFTLTAFPDAPANIHGIHLRGAGRAYSLSHNCPRVLPPSHRCIISVRFWPPFSGYYNGEFRVSMETHDIYVRLNGQADRRY